MRGIDLLLKFTYRQTIMMTLGVTMDETMLAPARRRRGNGWHALTLSLREAILLLKDLVVLFFPYRAREAICFHCRT